MLVLLPVLGQKMVLERLPGSEALAAELAKEAECSTFLPMVLLVLRERYSAMADYEITNKRFNAQTLVRF